MVLIMKTYVFLGILAMVLSTVEVSVCSAVTNTITPDVVTAKAKALFDGKGFDGWVEVLTDPNKTLEDVWKVQDGVIVCSGEPMGYLQSIEKFDDFELELEYRWPAEQTNGNSGVFVHVNGKPKALLPHAIEVQLKPGNAGDIMGFHGMRLKGDSARMTVMPNNPKAGTLIKLARQAGNELPKGEWNHVRILVEGKTVTAWFNGAQVNQAEGLDPVSGHIGLQSEGGTVYFRNIRITRK